MKAIGVVISHKNNEKKMGASLQDLKNIKNIGSRTKKGYGESVGHFDVEYAACGVHIVSREERNPGPRCDRGRQAG